MITAQDVAARIEHTLLKPEATPENIDALCDEAIVHGFAGVCVNPVFVAWAARRLAAYPAIRVITVVGFPLGANTTATKAFEARRALDDGAHEIDMVVHLGALIVGDRKSVRADIESVAAAVHRATPPGALKVILETATLDEERIILGCRCAVEGEADFVKTSTGFHPAGGATVEHVRLLRRHVSPIQVKAAGGIRTWAQAVAMIEAGAARLGTSASVAILRECPA